jgi:hypothetical protein
MEEIKKAIMKGKKGKSPGYDGISHEFFTTHWSTIRDDFTEVMQQMHSKGNITPQQKHGLVVLIPKTQSPMTSDQYRALTLLKTDTKILARIIAPRLNKWLPEIIYTSQHCGVQR